MPSDRARDVLRQIEIGLALDTQPARERQMRQLAHVRELLRQAKMAAPVTGFGVFGDLLSAISNAEEECAKRESEVFGEWVHARTTKPES